LAGERIKKHEHQKSNIKNNFWRTYDMQELDLLEEKADALAVFEFKWNKNKKVKIPTAFAKTYPDASFEVIN
jgi:hypothetical protein